MATATKPTIVLVPGAWHGPFHFQPLTTRLEAAGYEVHPMALPSTAKPGEEPENLGDHTPDVRAIASTIERAADAGTYIEWVEGLLESCSRRLPR